MEAAAMGLANRVVPKGQALPAAQALARELAALPQAALRGDRLSALQQHDLSLGGALANELRHGRPALEAETVAGARHFAQRGSGTRGPRRGRRESR